jgi:hypothetical protein
MRMLRLIAALMLVPTLGISATATARAKTSGARAFNGPRSPVGSPRQPSRSTITGPFCSSACIADHGPSECREHLWFYGGRDALAGHQGAIW